MSGPAVTSATHYQDANVPRRASFDDLRVGQVVAWQSLATNTGGWSGTVDEVSEAVAWVTVWAEPEQGRIKLQRDGGWDNAEVFLLRDAPAAPVTVRRDVFEQFRDAHELIGGHHPPRRVSSCPGCALIDNADTGDEQ